MYELMLSFGSILIAVLLGNYWTSTGTWYENLDKPDLNPTSRLISSVWSSLYFLIFFSFYLVLIEDPSFYVISIFMFQLFLNALWSYNFFFRKSPKYGLINILLLNLFIIITIILFYNISIVASLLLFPYLVWVMFATYLNYNIYKLNQ